MRLRKVFKKLPPTGRSLRNQKGVALIMATSALTILMWLASEVSFDTAAEYTVNSQNLNRIKAYYAAKSAANLGLLRVKIYDQLAQSPMAEQLGPYLDQIWQFKLVWPLPIADELNAVDKTNYENASKESLFDASWDLSITDDGSKIDLNDLVSPSKTLKEVAFKQLTQILETKNKDDREFQQRNGNFEPKEIVGLLADWQSDKNASANGGGDKKGKFASLGQNYPPNRAFRTLEEIKLIPGMTEEIYQLIAPQVTIYGMKAINPNFATKEVIKALDPGFTDEVVKEIITFRDDPITGPFKGKDDTECAKGFWSFAQGKGARLTDGYDKIPITCQQLSTFKISAIGYFGQGKGGVKREIEITTMNISAAAARVKNFITKENPPAPTQPAPGQQAPAAPTPAKAAPPGKGPPRIVYWIER